MKLHYEISAILFLGGKNNGLYDDSDTEDNP